MLPFLLFRSLLPRVTILYTPVIPSINRKESLVPVEEERFQKGNSYIWNNLMCSIGTLQKNLYISCKSQCTLDL
jgi:hypothetical protein